MTEVEVIRQAVEEAAGIPYDEFVSKTRRCDCFYARMVFAHQCRQLGMSLQSISRHVNRHYSTVMYMLERYNSEVCYVPHFRELAENTEAAIVRIKTRLDEAADRERAESRKQTVARITVNAIKAAADERQISLMDAADDYIREIKELLNNKQ